MDFKLDLREIGWAPYVMIGGGLRLGVLVLASDVPQAHLKPAYERRTGA